ncbi:MAG: succinate dehydrogenase, hydrophobic membrane anchor protein [Proteobacteria bacterium]|nr:succinate dehydrogenase, hydrophobic membrane anchor protein [Pseudomonadota bacterium]MBI3499180.1 succinate dehydrogenase, hydrophobic membrane anchor protein [Pseudomonadota bacterium]
MSMRTPLGRARGLGSAKRGFEHWWAQRLTAVALVPLTLWFVAGVVSLAGAGHDATVDWLSQPFVAVAMVLLIGATFYHAALGLQVVIEDYVHHEGTKLALVVIEKYACVALAVTALYAVLKIAFGG